MIRKHARVKFEFYGARLIRTHHSFDVIMKRDDDLIVY